jgi:hypothetical protein
VIRSEDLRGAQLETYELWRRLGMSEANALVEVARAHPHLVEPFDRLVGTFEALGMPSGAARTAAVGRGGSESAARRGLSDALKPGSPSIPQQFDRLEEALARLSDEDCKLIVEAARKRTSRGTSPSKKITETGR